MTGWPSASLILLLCDQQQSWIVFTIIHYCIIVVTFTLRGYFWLLPHSLPLFAVDIVLRCCAVQSLRIKIETSPSCASKCTLTTKDCRWMSSLGKPLHINFPRCILFISYSPTPLPSLRLVNAYNAVPEGSPCVCDVATVLVQYSADTRLVGKCKTFLQSLPKTVDLWTSAPLEAKRELFLTAANALKVIHAVFHWTKIDKQLLDVQSLSLLPHSRELSRSYGHLRLHHRSWAPKRRKHSSWWNTFRLST